jgi:hypothetical protein
VPAIVEQIAKHHRGLAVDGGIGDRETQLHGPHNP